MQSSTIIDNPQHWRNRAEEMRTLAEQTSHHETRRMMLDIAEAYGRLAKQTEERAAARDQGGAR